MGIGDRWDVRCGLRERCSGVSCGCVESPGGDAVRPAVRRGMFGEEIVDWEAMQLYRAVRSGLPEGAVADEHGVAVEICRRVDAMVIRHMSVRLEGLEKALVEKVRDE